jgi:tyrosyl-DNA phosphodiesterase 2
MYQPFNWFNVQEITPYILRIFQSFAWWKDYHSSPVTVEEQRDNNFCMMVISLPQPPLIIYNHRRIKKMSNYICMHLSQLSKIPLENYARWKFTTTPTGKSYLEAVINPCLGSTTMKPIRIATTQLEYPCPEESLYCIERYTQAEHAVAALGSAENVVFGGDMCWDDERDLPFPLPAGWVDAYPPDSWRSWTYDALWNEKFGEFNAYRASRTSLKKRSDRFICKLNDYRQSNIFMIGDNGIGPTYYRIFSSCDECSIALMPSCHRGVVLTLVPNEPA